jgi:P-type conjugative transfer protein TrbJ
MLHKSIWRVIIASLLAGTAAGVPLHQARAQIPVFDSANFSQNILTAARALQQINNQIRQLQNQAQMLANMARNLQSLNFSELNQMVSTLSQVSRLMDQGQGIAFDVQATTQAFAKLYPQQYGATVGSNQLFADAHQRWQNSMNAFQQTLVVQAQVARNVEADSGLTAKIQAICGSTDDANTLGQLLQAGLLYKRYQAQKDNPDLAQLMDGVRITPGGDRVTLNMSLSDDQMTSLIRHNTFAFKM